MLGNDTNAGTDNSSGKRKPQESAAGKYLAFPLSRERYGIEILKVQEIIGVSTITRVPRSSNHLKGVINLRGKIIPVVDLRLKFGLPPIPYDQKTCVVVVNIVKDHEKMAVGVIVDTVQEVMHFDDSQIEPAPDYGVALESSFIMGMGRKNSDPVIVLIDIEKILSDTPRIDSDGSKEEK